MFSADALLAACQRVFPRPRTEQPRPIGKRERQRAPQPPPERTRYHDSKAGIPLTPTRQPLKLLDDPEQLFKSRPAHFSRRVTYSLNLWHSVSVGPRVTRTGGVMFCSSGPSGETHEFLCSLQRQRLDCLEGSQPQADNAGLQIGFYRNYFTLHGADVISRQRGE